MRFIVAAIAAISFFSGCSAQAEILVDTDGSADLQLSLGLERAFLSYWADLRELDASLGPSPFDAESVAAGSQRFPEFQNMRIDVPRPDRLTANAGISSMNTLGQRFSGTGGRPLLQTGPHFAQFYLEQTGFSKLLAISDVAESEALSALLPQGNQSLSQSEFEELVEFSLEPYADNPLELARAASVTIAITAPARISSAAGAVVNGRRAVWTVPLSRLFRLQEPLVLKVAW